MQFTHVSTDDGSVVSVFIAGRNPLVAHSSHPNFSEIIVRVMDGDENVVELFDIAQTAATHFERLTERITTANGRLYLDGEEVNNSLATQVVRFLSEGVDNWKPLVRFFENVQANPNEHSREQLFSWLDARDFTITHDGLIVGYKGVASTPDGFVSVHSGRAMVDDVVHSGRIPNPIGSVVEMPRGEVHHDPSSGCSVGLHVADFDFASGWGDTLLEIHVNPRDVVSVPTESGWNKIRVCRYIVVDTIDTPHTSAVLEYEDDEDDYDWCEYCASGYCEEGDPNCEVCHDDDLTDEEFARDQIARGNVVPVDELDNYDGLAETPKQFHERMNGSVDSSWMIWNTDPSRAPMTRDEFRAAVKS